MSFDFSQADHIRRAYWQRFRDQILAGKGAACHALAAVLSRSGKDMDEFVDQDPSKRPNHE